MRRSGERNGEAMEGVFIVGVDTGVGKTAISGGLLKMLHGSRKVCFWKPVQTGTIVADDTAEIKTLVALPSECFMEPAYRFVEPLSPYMAGKKWGKRVDLAEMEKQFLAKQKEGFFTIIEGAGGLFVPLNETELLIDMMKSYKLPVIYVTEDRVGAINQTLLTLRVAREEKLETLGVIMTKSRRTMGNSESIAHFGKVEILAEFDPAEDVRTLVGQVGAHPRLRKLFNLPVLP